MRVVGGGVGGRGAKILWLNSEGPDSSSGLSQKFSSGGKSVPDVSDVTTLLFSSLGR